MLTVAGLARTLCSAGSSRQLATQAMSKKSFYAVVSGRKPGLYNTWEAAKAQVSGFKGAVHKGFKSEHEAMDYLQQQGVAVTPVAAVGAVDLAPSSSGRPLSGSEPLQPQQMQHDHHQQQQTQPSQNILGRRMRMEFDGASKSNPGDAGFGAVLYDEASGVEISRLCRYMGPYHTNNQAEWAGLLAGMAAALELGCRDLIVQGDSKLVIQQLLGAYQVKADGLMPYHQLALRLKQRFGRLEAVHVLREYNKVADELSNLAIRNYHSGADRNIWTLEDFEERCAVLGVSRKAAGSSSQEEAVEPSAKRRRL